MKRALLFIQTLTKVHAFALIVTSWRTTGNADVHHIDGSSSQVSKDILYSKRNKSREELLCILETKKKDNLMESESTTSYAPLIATSPTAPANPSVTTTRPITTITSQYVGQLQVNAKTGNTEYISTSNRKLVTICYTVIGILFLPFFCIGLICLIPALLMTRVVVVFDDTLGKLQLCKEFILLRKRKLGKQVSYTDVASVAIGPSWINGAAFDTVLVLRDGTRVNLGCFEVLGDAQFTAETITTQINKRGGNIV